MRDRYLARPSRKRAQHGDHGPQARTERQLETDCFLISQSGGRSQGESVGSAPRCDSALVGVGAGVDCAEHRQPCVVYSPRGIVDGVGGVGFCPVRLGGGDSGIDLPTAGGGNGGRRQRRAPRLLRRD
jgi:hypothetical protein